MAARDGCDGSVVMYKRNLQIDSLPEMSRYGMIEYSGNPVVLWDLNTYNSSKSTRGK